MTGMADPAGFAHSHVFLGDSHASAERRTWAVIWLCGAMMLLEIAGGILFGSIALVADGLHMSTHAGALLLAALAYTYARSHAEDPRFTFGTGKLGDLAGFTSAIVLAMIALLIAYEAVTRLVAPVPIAFAEAIPIAVLGLAVNAGSAWLLSGGGHHHHGHDHHGHHHGHGNGHGPHHGHDHGHDEEHRFETATGPVTLSVFEDGVPPVFRLEGAVAASIETRRSDGSRQVFAMEERGGFLESTTPVPEPHTFEATVSIGAETFSARYSDDIHAGGAAHRDNNMRAAVVHVVADAAVSVLVIVGLLLARALGWAWMDPLAGLIGAGVIASWSYGLIRDTGAILLDMTPDRAVAEGMRRTIEAQGDSLADLHVWRLGPGHLGAIVSVVTAEQRETAFYRALLSRFATVSHLTIEVRHAG